MFRVFKIFGFRVLGFRVLGTLDWEDGVHIASSCNWNSFFF